MATLKVNHKTFNEKTVCQKMDLSVIFVVYDTLKKSQLLLKKKIKLVLNMRLLIY